MTTFVFHNISSKCLSSVLKRSISVSSARYKDYSCKLVIIGGGSGGCTMAAKFQRHISKDAVIVIEPSWEHYYQPLFTLVGAGVTSVAACKRLEGSVLPKNVTWLKDAAECVNPDEGFVKTVSGHMVHYEYMIIAAGLQNDYEKIPGLLPALKEKHCSVSTIYAPEYCEKTWANFQKFKSGYAIFTVPNTPIKCPGAPQKIAYLFDAYLTKTNNRKSASITYNTCLPVIFGVKKYADSLVKVAERKQIQVNYKSVLKSINPERKEAVFFDTDNPDKTRSYKYDLLHVTPPMNPPSFIRDNTKLSDASGFLDVDKYTLQHKKYANIYGIGDCTNTPNSKTAAAIAKQSYVLEVNLLEAMLCRAPVMKYDGYGACPLVTSYNTCIIAEFLYDGVVRETMPYDQSQESRMAYYMKRYLFPTIYWNLMLKGRYHGPELVRKFINPLGRN